MNEQSAYAFGVFISHSHADKERVTQTLRARLKDAGLRACIDIPLLLEPDLQLHDFIRTCVDFTRPDREPWRGSSSLSPRGAVLLKAFLPRVQAPAVKRTDSV
jgi:hypothetical protein